MVNGVEIWDWLQSRTLCFELQTKSKAALVPVPFFDGTPLKLMAREKRGQAPCDHHFLGILVNLRHGASPLFSLLFTI